MSILKKILFWRRNRFSHFKLLTPVAHGGMGKVWKAEDRHTGMTVAVKIMEPETAEIIRKIKSLFGSEEGEVALQLNHPNVVRTYEFGHVGRRYYVVMEFIDGPNLKHMILADEPRLKGRRMDICLQIGRGLTYIHHRGLVHRDFSPKNVLLNRKNVVKIIDFGLTIPADVKQMRGVDQSGTASYMAPEQVRRQEVGVRADIYAFGITAYEIMSGRRPFPEHAEQRRKMEQHLNIPALPLRDVCPNMPRQLEDLLSQCIEKDPSARPPTMDAVLKDLRNIADEHWRGVE
jgi:serine/threonine protein kinase